MTIPSVFFHVDIDAFFASVEQLDNPTYRGKPVIVGGEPGKRGVVSTCSYEARKFGVHSAMPMRRACSLCPDGIFLRGRMHRYNEKSREVMSVFGEFSPEVRQMSIDEAFLDMSGTEKLLGLPEKSAITLKERIRKVTGLTVSVGIAQNKYIAKIASGINKPDGLCLVRPGEEQAFMEGLRVKDIWGIGEKTRTRLEEAGFSTVGSLLRSSKGLLQSILGTSGGDFLYAVIRGIDTGVFSGESSTKSISTERTFEYDIADGEFIETALLELSSEIMYRLLDEGFSGKTIHLKIRYSDFRTVSIQETGDTSVNDTGDLFVRVKKLFYKKYDRSAPIRLLGIAIHNITEGSGNDQLHLFDQGTATKKRKIEEALHALARKRGKRLVTRARLLCAPPDQNE